MQHLTSAQKQEIQEMRTRKIPVRKIAGLYGVSRETIRLIRITEEITASPVELLPPEFFAELGKLPDKQLSIRYDISLYHVRQERKQRGIGKANKKRPVEPTVIPMPTVIESVDFHKGSPAGLVNTILKKEFLLNEDERKKVLHQLFKKEGNEWVPSMSPDAMSYFLRHL